MPNPPALLVDAAREALDAVDAMIHTQVADLSQRHIEVFERFRQELESLFYRYSLLPEARVLTPDEQANAQESGVLPPGPVRVWDSTRLRQEGVSDQIRQLLRDTVEQLRDADAQAFTDTLAGSAEEGFGRSLWMLALSGLETIPYFDEMPDEWSQLLLDDDIDGMNWQDRLDAWRDITDDKMGRWMTASMAAGYPLDETLGGFDRLALSHTQRVSGLFANETFRAFTFGGMIAAGLVLVDEELVEVWVTRQDAKVCLICRAKHLTVTKDRPIDDSHPGCRCLKVRMPKDGVPTPMAYGSFRSLEEPVP